MLDLLSRRKFRLNDESFYAHIATDKCSVRVYLRTVIDFS